MRYYEIIAESHWGDCPAGKFLDLLTAWERANLPTDAANDTSFDINVEKHGDNVVYLDNLWVPAELRSKGWGAKIMEALTQFASDTGVKIYLTPVWQDDENDPHFALSSWYMQFGFEPASEGLVFDPTGD